MSRNDRQLADALRRIDGRGYKAYRDIKGTWVFEDFTLEVVHVQGDPFAAPSRLAVTVALDDLPLSDDDVEDPSRRTGAEDALWRSFARALRGRSSKSGSGKSGQLSMLAPCEVMLPQTACEILDEVAIVRFTAGLPARGRRVLGRQAAGLLCERLPLAVESGLLGADRNVVTRHADAAEDQDRLRAIVARRGWVGFVADGAVLPRASGVSQEPLKRGAVPWQSPDELAQTVTLPHAGEVRGSAIPRGITLICGGGYHGKSTLLRALCHGVYNTVPGDGRELVVTRHDAVFVRAEDGRRVCRVDISPFIDNLPDGRDTGDFTSDNASGSTSQAANIVEALEVGSRLLLFDEDTSATNFMVRDDRMQALVEPDGEPITPLCDRIPSLRDDLGVDLVLVVGGSGAFFDHADTVVRMDGYVPRVVTGQARAVVEAQPRKAPATLGDVALPAARTARRSSLDPNRGKRDKVRARGTSSISFGHEEIDITAIAQLVHEAQTRTIGDWLRRYARRYDADMAIAALCKELSDDGWDLLSDTVERGFGDRMVARSFELAAALNRLRTLTIDKEDR